MIRFKQTKKSDCDLKAISQKRLTVLSVVKYDVKTLKGSEFAESGFTINEQPMRFIIRYREGIETYHQVRYKGQMYNIQSIINDDGRNHTLTIFCKKVE
ncbi:phage head closure protein [Staphylococcus simulans]|uniref:phage head closure protein n=1 Tax=Staphylococcus simulans TaxID=1286 RepID=UPI003CE96326